MNTDHPVNVVVTLMRNLQPLKNRLLNDKTHYFFSQALCLV
jgi:hypothetical protein